MDCNLWKMVVAKTTANEKHPFLIKHDFMKKFIRILASVAVPGVIAITSCHKDNNPTPTPTPTPTALQSYISQDTSLSIYNAALAKSGDKSLVSGDDSVTVLIPTNQAFRNAGITESSITNMTNGAADSLLRYHIVNGSIALQNGVYSPFTTALGNRVYGFGGVVDSNYFNGVQSSVVSVPGSKGTVYRLNAPLGVPFSDRSAYFNADTSLSLYAQAVQRAGIDISSDTGFTTVFVPNNTAFRNAGYSSIADINNADSATLRNVLMYNMLPGQYFANSYNGLTTVGTSAGGNISVGTSATGPTFTGIGSSTPYGFAGSGQLVGDNAYYQPTTGLLTP